MQRITINYRLLFRVRFTLLCAPLIHHSSEDIWCAGTTPYKAIERHLVASIDVLFWTATNNNAKSFHFNLFFFVDFVMFYQCTAALTQPSKSQ